MVRWWEIEDKGGWPPFWCWVTGAPPLDDVKTWPAEWRQRPHP